MTDYTAADIQAVLAQVSASRVALYKEIQTDLAAIVAKLDQAKADALFSDGEPPFVTGIRNTVNAFNSNVALIPGMTQAA